MLRSLFPADLPPGTAGDPGVIGPDGPVWRIVREKAILAGGPAALLLQVAHPLVAAGVAAHSDFESDPLGRLRRTLDSPADRRLRRPRPGGDGGGGRWPPCTARCEGCRRRGRPTGPTTPSWPSGSGPRSCSPPWGRSRTSSAPLADDDKAAFYERYKVVGRMFGVTDDVIPPTYADFDAYVRRMEDEVLAVGDDARAIARGIFEATVAGPTWWSRPTMQLAAAALLPPGVRRDYGLPWGRGRRATYAVRPAAGAARGSGSCPARARYWQHYRMAQSRIAVRRRLTPQRSGGSAAQQPRGRRPGVRVTGEMTCCGRPRSGGC